MSRYLYAAVTLGLISVAIPLRAANKPHAGTDRQIVFTGAARHRPNGRDLARRNLELLTGVWAGCRRLPRGFHYPSGQWRQPACVRQKDPGEQYCSVTKSRRASGSQTIGFNPGCQDSATQAVGRFEGCSPAKLEG
jgi:hypothetical protein